MRDYVFRYFFCPASSRDDWRNDLNQFRSNPGTPVQQPMLTSDLLSDDTVLDLKQQFSLINQLPNLHKWPWDGAKVNIYHLQKFSIASRWYPGSPRNRIIQAFCYRDEPRNIVFDCLYNAFVAAKTVRYPKNIAKVARPPSSRRKRSLREALGYSVDDAQDIVAQVNHINVLYRFPNLSSLLLA